MRPVSLQSIPAFRASLLFAGGILAARLLPDANGFPVAAVVSVACAAIFLVLALRRLPSLIPLAAAVLCFVSGFARLSLDRHELHNLPDSLCNRPVVLAGIIRGPVSVDHGRRRFLLSLESVRVGTTSVRYSDDVLATFIPATRDSLVPALREGTVLAVLGRLERPSAERNPGEFSPKAYYEANGISMLLRVRGSDAICVLSREGGPWWRRHVVAPARDFILAEIDRTIGGSEGGFLKGLLLGERTGMTRDVQEAFVNAGVAHVLAVSGSNVAVVAGVFLLLFELLRFPRRARWLVTGAGILLYMAVTGSQPSVVRATIMALVFLGAAALERRTNAYNVLGIAGLIILGIDGRQLFDIGFLLSFGAVLSIIALYPKMNSWISLLTREGAVYNGVRSTLRVCAVSLAATLGTLPLTALSFGKVSLVGVMANILVIPATGLSVILGMVGVLAGLLNPWLASVYATVNVLILHWTLAFTAWAGSLSFASIDTSRFAPADALPFYAGLTLVFACLPHAAGRGIILFLISLCVSLVVPESSTRARPVGIMRLTFIDVGQGDAVLAELPDGRSLLVDAGPRTEEYDAGERVVVPYLKRRGISKIDLLILSHPHSDHIGGIPAVLRNVAVNRVVDGGQIHSRHIEGLIGLPPGGPGVDPVDVSSVTVLADSLVRLYPLLPARRMSEQGVPGSPDDADNASLVVKLQYGKVSFLLGGDADAGAERQMVSMFDTLLRADVLKANHHGSSTSSAADFLDAVRPTYVVISVGRNNRFHHPSPEIIRRLEERGIDPLRTDEEGAIVFETDGEKLTRLRWH